MAGAFSRPILVSEGTKDTLLEKVPLSGPGSSKFSESWLQDLLYRFPDSLPIEEIDDSFSGLVSVCREMQTPAGPIDVVYISKSGRPVLVEAKLWRNPESRRKVIAQILDYAKELSRWSYESFDAAVRAARRREDGETPKGLFDIVRQAIPETDEARFYDSVTLSLHRGDFLLLIVGDGIREGAATIAEFLDNHASLHFTLGMVEMAVYGMPDGTRLVQPRVLAQSAIMRRIVVQLDAPGVKLADDSHDEANEEGISEELIQTRIRYQSFWQEVLAKLVLDDKSQPIPKPAISTSLYFRMPTGTNAWMCARLLQSGESVGVYLAFPRDQIGTRHYESLLAERHEIERAIKTPLEWGDKEKIHRIIARQLFPGDLLANRRSEVQSWFVSVVNEFINVFKPRLESIVRTDRLG